MYVNRIIINMGNNAGNSDTLNELRIEDYIWIIYIFLAIFALVSNHFEKEYELKHEKKDEKTFRNINTFIFAITLIIYIYFVSINYKHLKKLNQCSSKKRILIENAGFIASVLFLIGGIISLLISIFGSDDDDFILNFF